MGFCSEEILFISPMNHPKGHAHCNSEYIGNGDRYLKHCYFMKLEVIYGLSISMYDPRSRPWTAQQRISWK